MDASPPGSRSTESRNASELDATLRRRLYLIALRTLADEEDARDAVQEILGRAVEAVRLDRVPGDVPLAGFVFGIARHVFADLVRVRIRQARSGVAMEPQQAARERSPLEVLIAEEDANRLVAGLSRLSDSDRALLHLCYVEGKALADIARDRGLPPERLRKQKSRAIARLREFFRGPGHESPTDPTSEA